MVGKLPTLIYLAITPNPNEDEFIDSDRRSLLNHKIGL
jgi:hypothetical protein